MREVREVSRSYWVLPLALAFLAGSAGAARYPSYECASEKMDAAANRCDKVLKAWSIWAQTGKDRQRMIDQADRAFDAKWASAEDKAARQSVDCAEMTLSGADMKALMDMATDDIVADVTDGLDLVNRKDAICGSKLLKSAATMCQKLLRAESSFIKDLSRDPDGFRNDLAQSKASLQFGQQWARTVRKACPTTAIEGDIEDQVETLSDDVVTNIIVSPNVPDDAFMAITHPAGGAPGNPVSYEGDMLVPQCQDSSAFTFFVKRGSVNKLLMYYYGGGACWNSLTCGLPACNQDVDPTPPGISGRGGFADLSNPDNPFKDWNIVQVPYCTCDIHIGDSAVDYEALGPFPAKHVEHRGYDNAKLAEKWAREHILNPTDMFVSGSSAGSYGALVHGAHLSAAYPASSINVMGDGGNGVATQEFMDTNFNNWGALENLPDVPGIIGVPSSQISIPLIIEAAASHFPNTNWSNYTTAFDGGEGGQTGFYNMMLNPLNPFAALTWHEASCQFNENMRQQAVDTFDAAAAENDNYRYYIATGSTHTGFGNPRVYDDTTGGVPPLVDWVNAMIDGDPSWTNVEADPFNVLFPGTCDLASDNPGARCNLDADCPNGSCSGDDVKPDPLQPPFTLDVSGPDPLVVVDCP